MKRIVIFCNGTWSGADAPYPTNVWRLSQALVGTGPDGTRQQGFYVAGVGTGRGLSGVSGVVDKLAGGGFGWGLDESILDAYRTLMRAYDFGDEIHVFGFSRGAYTARSLVGLIRRAGILDRSQEARVPEAMSLYRTRDDPRTQPDSPQMMAYRAAYAPATATSRAELDWRRQNGRVAPPAVLRLAYLGVWDTVGALGVPGYFTTAPVLNHRYQFHDTDLSSMVRRARHAVAIDERRLAFVPTLWTNLAELNREELDPARPLPGGLPYRQEWFPGDHGSVGGGQPRLGLSSYACDWIAEGAGEAGLAFDPARLEAIRASRNIRDDLLSLSDSWMSRVWRMDDREGPSDPRDVSQAAQERIRTVPGYAPKTLAKVIRAFRP